MTTVTSQLVHIEGIDPCADRLTRYYACKAMARGYAEAKKSERTRLSHARAFCAVIVKAFWNVLCERNGTTLRIKPISLSLPVLAVDAHRLADDIGRLVADFPAEDAGYLIGSIYTVMLPSSLRSKMGAYYTPPPLVARLLDQIEAAGFDLARGTAIDPACGGGAFLAPLALRMVAHDGGASPEWTLRRLGKRLKGLEIDRFAAWMTTVLLEAAVLPLCVAAKRRLPDVVVVGDALRPRDHGQFELVIGNPPYGRVTLDEPMRNHYARSLYGHANLYGLFTDLALRLVKPAGILAYLTPTSFLGGQYFKALRQLLTDNATPFSVDFVADRDGVFDDVLQETLLTTYIRGIGDAPATVSTLIPEGLNAATIERVGAVHVNKEGNPWLLPRSANDAAFLNAIAQMPTRLADIGYVVTTGQLVWNRHKHQLRTVAEAGSLPLIWAESVTPNGFAFSADRRNHVPYINVETNQPHLVTRHETILVQRTTSKEQDRRLLAAVLPQAFLDRSGGAVIENHLNLVHSPVGMVPRVSLSTIVALLNSEAADRAFRCISGSVAVSAYELNALPLPTIQQLAELEQSIQSGAVKAMIERQIAIFYGIA
ncbi:Eco57I restriction-modification methylase domain-containing protein [Burkholderia glumae]|uniref:Eco57I restriction-modification methylase domain-containing protein n=1 Tax=Burkholderia glumae TaxID=337 RepID=UPI0001A4B8B0|nr:Eco57I restriction-modification methylase domain-containing protein [Burkholderia glumae]ACR32967.1 Eco57I restriction endonuclease [Burkholderia glumae BGR1]